MSAASPSPAYRAFRTPSLRIFCSARSVQHSPMQQVAAYVYSGPGAGTRSVLSALQSLKQAFQPHVLVEPLDAAQLLEGSWRHSCMVLVMPGGADLPYCRHLDGDGTRLIREYVEGGGAYLGLCAGAYFACARVEFEPGSRLEVVGDRELAFFPGTARGSVYSGFDYASESGSVAARLRFRTAGAASRTPRWQGCVDYVNGGPCFELTNGTSLEAAGTADGMHGGIELLATYLERGNAAAAVACRVGQGCAVLCGSHPELHPSWLSLPGGSARSDALLEEQQQRRGVAAFVDGLPARHVQDKPATAGDGCTAAYAAHVAQLSSALEAAAEGRWRFWRSLLAAAALGDVLRDESTAATLLEQPLAA